MKEKRQGNRRRSIVLLVGFFAFSGCNATARAITEYPLLKSASLPHRIARGSDGNMWFTEQTGQRIGRISMDGALAEFALPSSGNPIGIVAGPDGNMWFTSRRAIGSAGSIAAARSPSSRQV